MNMTYGRIKAEDITGAMKASSSAMTHAEKCSNDRGLVWNQTVSIIMERVSIDPATVEPTKESIQSRASFERDYVGPYPIKCYYSRVWHLNERRKRLENP